MNLNANPKLDAAMTGVLVAFITAHLIWGGLEGRWLAIMALTFVASLAMLGYRLRSLWVAKGNSAVRKVVDND